MKTDIQVQQDVLVELKWEPSVNATDVGVEVKDSVAALVGHVDGYVENGMPSALFNASPASRRSPSKSTFTLPELGKRNDDDIERAVENVMEGMNFSPKKRRKATPRG